MTSSATGPQRIVCLTEETTEWLYLLGQEARIVGISGYTVRPRRARDEIAQHKGDVAGTVVAGVVRPGQRVRILPAGRESTVARIVTADGVSTPSTKTFDWRPATAL